MREANFQSKVKVWLEDNGCYVLKYPQSAITRAGVSDLIWFRENKYGFLEIKKSEEAPFRPGQEAFLEKMSKWTLATMVCPENFEDVKGLLVDFWKGRYDNY